MGYDNLKNLKVKSFLQSVGFCWKLMLMNA